MFDTIKKHLYFIRLKILMNEGIIKREILPFEDSLYERLSKVYINGIPMSIQIKYLRPTTSPGQCEYRSLYIAMGFDDARWVCGDVKNLELLYGGKIAWHYWVEHDGWVYDPTSLRRFKKELYYKMYMPKNIKSWGKEKYSNSKIYQDIVKNKIEDLMPGGKERYQLCETIPFIQEIAETKAQISGDDSFLRELNEYLKEIEYDYEQIRYELYSSSDDLIRKRTN